jgi:ribosome-binding factor A
VRDERADAPCQPLGAGGGGRGDRRPEGPGVSVSPDLHDARVFVSVLGSPKRRRAALKGLDSAAGLLQLRLARELSLKRTPRLAFEYDPTVEYGVRMTRLIDELAPEGPPEDDDAGASDLD